MLFEIFIPFVIVGGAYAVRLLFKKPLYYDPYGKETKKLSKDDIDTFIQSSIVDAEQLENKEIKIIGDMDEIKKIIEKTKTKQFKIDAIIGPSAEQNMHDELLTILRNTNIKIRIAAKRPQHHFAIIGPNILVESPHTASLAENRVSLGIKRPYMDYYELFRGRFNAGWAESIDLMPRTMQQVDHIPAISSSFDQSNIIPTTNTRPSGYQ